jgi:hypothetical protein
VSCFAHCVLIEISLVLGLRPEKTKLQRGPDLDKKVLAALLELIANGGFHDETNRLRALPSFLEVHHQQDPEHCCFLPAPKATLVVCECVCVHVCVCVRVRVRVRRSAAVRRSRRQRQQPRPRTSRNAVDSLGYVAVAAPLPTAPPRLQLTTASPSPPRADSLPCAVLMCRRTTRKPETVAMDPHGR